MKTEWTIHQDREEEDARKASYTITLNPKVGGWNTDSGYDGYGLRKELAIWICKMLNKCGEKPPLEIDEFGYWDKADENDVL